ncbi:MAG: hypothetical protein GY941_21730 [Planctomycetes bacterium]|nr:hypothetical protein [Planctomycetota bacterium]
MAVEQTTAWMTSTGQCFGNKATAYHEEMVILINNRAEYNKRGFDDVRFDTVIADQQQLVIDLKRLKTGLTAKKDKKILDKLVPMLRAAESWLAEAEQLQDMMQSAG